MSAHNIFVLDVEGKPLTPTTNAKAKKLLKGNQAVPVWNKFGRFGVQMLVETRKETPRTSLGIDLGTKFEGYAVVIGKENTLSVMWKLPEKKKIMKKLEERRILRRARRQRKTRKREARFDNRSRKGFIAPSQKVLLLSRLKAIQEFLKTYPVDTVAIEDVKFNHRDNKGGKNFSTVEIGKSFFYDWIRQRAYLQMFEGHDTKRIREEFGYAKSREKNVENFTSHCSDALSIALASILGNKIIPGDFVVVDDTYRCVRRKLHDTQPAKGGVRDKYSTGNYKGIKKGTMCNFGQVCGGIKDKTIRTYDWQKKRLSKSVNKISWLSNQFKFKEVKDAIHYRNKLRCPLAS